MWFFISNQLFVVKPWSLMIEQDLSELKSIPIWINLRNAPLHLWHAKGLGKLSSFVGIPIMLDKKTTTRSRMTYARICVEVVVDSDFPSHIDALVDNVKLKIIVEYSWKPMICTHCAVFGSSQEKCASVADVAAAAASSLTPTV